MDPNILKEAMAAYQAVYNQEDVEHLDEMGQQGGRVTGSNPNVYKPAVTKSGPAGGGMGGRRGGGSSPGGIKPVAKPVTPAAKPAATAPAAKPVTPAAKPAAKPAATAPAAPVTKPAATPSAKVEPSTPATKPSAMDTWAKANPRLAQAQKIRQQGGSRAEVNKSLYNKGTAAAEKTPTVVKASYDMLNSSNIKGMIEAYADVYAPQQIDEISQKTATSAYAKRRTGEFEGDDASDRVAKTNKLKDRIEKKFGKEAGKHADRAADVETFGRKDASGRRKQSPQPRIQTSDHENQREFKRELRIKRDRRLRAARGEDTNEQVDIFDVVLEFLQAEGFAETLEEAEWMMANELDADDIDAILGEGKSSRPRYPGGRGVLDQERRDEKREASAENMRGHTAGPGTVTKNPKKLRKQKAMGEHG